MSGKAGSDQSNRYNMNLAHRGQNANGFLTGDYLNLKQGALGVDLLLADNLTGRLT